MDAQPLLCAALQVLCLGRVKREVGDKSNTAPATVSVEKHIIKPLRISWEGDVSGIATT
jgi:hypothetical protein